MRAAALACAAGLAVCLPAFADLGDPDPTFGGTGVVSVPNDCPQPASPFDPCVLRVQQVLGQPDGKVLVLARKERGGYRFSGTVSAFLWRYHADGRLDTAFGTEGKVALFTNQQSQPVREDGRIALQADGRILASALQAEPCPSWTCPTAVQVKRLNSDGSLDTSFGSAGIALPPTHGAVFGLHVHDDGRVSVALLGYSALRVARLLPSGIADSSYGSGGVATSSVPHDGNPFVRARSAFHPDGSVAVAISGRNHIGKLTPSGQVDSGFNATGSLSSSASGSVSIVALSFQGANLLVGMIESFTSSSVTRLARLRPDGAPDPSFGDGGARAYADGALAYDLGIAADGRIVGTGSKDGSVAFMRWLADGTNDPSLRGGGRAVTGLAGTAQAMHLLSADKALVGIDERAGRFGVPDNVLTSDRAFVMQQYRDFLGREGDEQGIAAWTQQLSSRAITRAQLVERFFTSDEFQSRFAPLVRLYLAYFLRYPDYAGLQFWGDRYRSGSSLASISDLFAASPEFQQRYGALDNAQFVNRIYENVLGRSPDPEGFAHWYGQLQSGAMTRGQVMLAFSEAAEYRALSLNEVYVTMMYAGMLRRAPDADGFRSWVAYMDSGGSGLTLIEAFLGSAEYRARFGG